MGIQSITILGRRWGNHFSASILVNGAQVHHIPLQCGTGDYFAQAGFEWLDEWLDKQGITGRKRHASGIMEPAWRYCQDRGIIYHVEGVDVARKKDL